MTKKRKGASIPGERDRDNKKNKGKFHSSDSSMPKEKRYRFRNFNDRIDDIDISSIQRIGGYRGSGPDSTDSTWFELSLIEWKELNCSAAFAEFCYAVTPMTGTLAKLLFNRERIVKEIFEVLINASKDDSNHLGLVPVLSLTAMLAKDLGSEFYCYFAEFFRLLSLILPSITDPETIEAAFTALLYIFKCILNDLLSDLPGAFHKIIKPFTNINGKQYLRRFCAQCFGYLLRKSIKISGSGLFETVESNDNIKTKEFIADAFVAAILDDSTGRYRTCLKGLLLEITGYTKLSNSTVWNDILRFLTIKLLDCSDLNRNGPIWKIFAELLDDPENSFIIDVLTDAFAFRRGTRVQYHSQLLSGLVRFKSIEVCVHFLRSMDLETTLKNRQSTLAMIESVLDNNCMNLLSLCRGLVEVSWLHYDLILSDLVYSYLSRCSDPIIVIELLEILLPKYSTASASVSSNSVKTLCCTAFADTPLSLRALKILINHLPSSSFPVEILPLIISKFETMIKSKVIDSRDELILWTEVVANKKLHVKLSSNDLVSFVENMPLLYPEQLKAVQVALSLSENLNCDLDNIQKILLQCLRSHSSEWRQNALELLSELHQDDIIISDTVIILLKIENVPSDLENYRGKILNLKKLELFKVAVTEENKKSFNLSQLLIMNYLLGFNQINLSLLWPEGHKILSKFAFENSELFSTLMVEIFKGAGSEQEKNKLSLGAEAELEEGGEPFENCSYDFEIDDNGLNNLKKIRFLIQNPIAKSFTKHEDIVTIHSEDVLIPSILKLFATYPESCLSRSSFREAIFIPLILSSFAEIGEKNNLIQSNLGSVLQTFAGIKLEPSENLAFNFDQVESLLLRFLSHGDLQLQNRSLDALFNTKKYGSSFSNQWKNRLKSLLNDNLFREELTNLVTEAESLPKMVHWHSLLAPLIIRILFGRFIARKGAASGRFSLPLRRKMIMSCFGTWDVNSMALIVDFLLTSSKEGPRQQLGLLNTLEDVFDSLGRKLDENSMNRLIKVLIDLYTKNSVGDDDDADLMQDETLESENSDQQIDSIQNVKNENFKGTFKFSFNFLLSFIVSPDDRRRIRQLAMKRFLQLFKLFDTFIMKRFAPFLPELFNSVLNPRINQLSLHFTNSNTSSALLEILVCIASNCSGEELFDIFTLWSPSLWEKEVEALRNPFAKPLVVSQLLSFFEGVIINSMKKSETLKSLLIPMMCPLLDAFDFRLQDCSNPQITLRIVTLAQVICPYVASHEQADRLCKTFEGILRIKTINESIRSFLLNALSQLLTKASKDTLSKSLFEIVSAQWNIIKGRSGRESLCALFESFALLNPESSNMSELASLLRDLNSWLPGKLSEPNFDVRLAAFAKLRRSIDSGSLSSTGPLNVFVPISWSMIYFLQDADELSIRNQSFGVLKVLIKKLAASESSVLHEQISSLVVVESESEAEPHDEQDEVMVSDVKQSALPLLIQQIILPAIKKGLKSKLEIIRVEFVALLDLLISTFPSKHPFNSLFALIYPLGVHDNIDDLDEENIFRNIYHIQEPRRNRAIRQIGELAKDGKLTGLTRSIIEDLLLPLIVPTAIPDPRGEVEFEVSEAMQKDSIVTYGALMAQLPPKAFLRKLAQFVKEISENNRSDLWNRAILRVLPAMISQFSITEDVDDFSQKVDEEVLPAMFRLLHKSNSTGNPSENSMTKKLAKTASGAPLASSDKISVKNSLRVPIAISIGQLIKLVSNNSLDSPVVLSHLPRLLIDLLNVLKQKDAETREVARDALVKIMGIFGTAFLPFLLKEARILLNRGYQRHVLTYTAHAILTEFLRLQKLESVENIYLCNLDASADLLVDMALASSFGFQADERSTIEWSGKQPEVRASKGPEILALTAQFTSQSVLEKSVIQKITNIALLDLEDSENGLLNTRGTGALDEKAEKISSVEGETLDMLLKSLFLNGIYPLLAREPERLPALLAAMYTILEYPCDSGSRSHLHRLQSRVFEFISHVLNNIKAEDVDIIARIIPFIQLTKDYILERGKHVNALTSAIILFNQFVSYKYLHAYLTDLQGLLQKLFAIILKGNSGTSEGSAHLAAAYKLTSTLIRDWPDLEVTDTQIKALIEYTRLQLENTHQQSLTFSLIRSLITRQIVLLQLFELMDTIRTVMLTSHQPATRQQCRSVYVHFLTNYPMSTKKVEEQLDFLLANVRYEFASGRESCIEAMNSLILKLPTENIEEIAEAWFVGLSVQLAKENSTDGSNEVSEVILKTISALFNRIKSGKRRDNLELLLLRWILQSPKLSVQGASWKIVLPILEELSVETRKQILFKALEMIVDDSIPEDLLVIVIKSVISAVNKELCSNDLLQSIVHEASNQKFFKNDCELSTRHYIALLWNSLLQ